VEDKTLVIFLLTVLTPKCPSASIKPLNQLFEYKSDLFKKLSLKFKLYLLFKNSIN
jgi:hypothetical protein